jgi:hypothetical protein
MRKEVFADEIIKKWLTSLADVVGARTAHAGRDHRENLGNIGRHSGREVDSIWFKKWSNCGENDRGVSGAVVQNCAQMKI